MNPRILGGSFYSTGIHKNSIKIRFAEGHLQVFKIQLEYR
jgi:hypothetical protein